MGKRPPGLDFLGDSFRFKKLTVFPEPASLRFWTDLPDVSVWRRKTAEVERNKSVLVRRKVGKDEFSSRSEGEGRDELDIELKKAVGSGLV